MVFAVNWRTFICEARAEASVCVGANFSWGARLGVGAKEAVLQKGLPRIVRLTLPYSSSLLAQIGPEATICFFLKRRHASSEIKNKQANALNTVQYLDIVRVEA